MSKAKMKHWGTMARFVNHSCTPNTQFVEKRHNKEVHVMAQTTREINPGEEVTVNYQVTWFTLGQETKEVKGQKKQKPQKPQM
ncbi:hypothetical protein PHMEG_0005229 [Phytophthora megakarya]|uniref:SET domain-containing protein n=1 Tax=Phytophthora megakarya TaxID=4795 RepID=A0A225WTL4_9STRA|nr:hypothetical protein PHMEG_0005229 [Phytophthora megakarya]